MWGRPESEHTRQVPPPGGETRQRAIAGLAELRELLGPDALQTDGGVETDDGVLEQLVDEALTELRGMLPGYSGPEASRLTTLVLELADIRLAIAAETMARRLDCVSQVQRALGRLRGVGSVDQMIAQAPRALCECCGFQGAILFRVEDGIVTPAAAHRTGDSGWDAKVRRFFSQRPPVRLDAMVLETEMLRRRTPVIVHDAMNDPRALRELTRVSNVRSYVAAPVMPEGRVIGFLHATTGERDDILDRDVLWAFAEGYGYALERTILLQRLHQQSERISELVRSTESALGEIREAGLQITSTSAGLAASESEPVRSAMFSAPDSRIHQLLTRRELEIIELLADGARAGSRSPPGATGWWCSRSSRRCTGSWRTARSSAGRWPARGRCGCWPAASCTVLARSPAACSPRR